MKNIVLLGAGASIEAGVPGSFKMSKKMLDEFAKESEWELHTRILRFAIGGLIFQNSAMGNDPYNGIDIEDLFNSIKSLSSRRQSEMAPFVSSWHPLLDELEQISSSKKDSRSLHRAIYDAFGKDFKASLKDKSSAIDKAIDKKIENSNSSASPGKEIYSMIADAFVKLTRRSPSAQGSNKLSRELAKFNDSYAGSANDQLFEDTSEKMIQKLVDMVWIVDKDKVSYLTPLVTLSPDEELTIATLNYDNAIELAASQTDTILTTGIDYWSKSGGFSFNGPGIRLLKLHGSIDWSLKACTNKPIRHHIIEQVKPQDMKLDNFRPAVIFGEKNKLTAQGPSLDLLHAFRKALTNSTHLTVIGYSFRDEHINEYIGQWINGASERKIRIINGENFLPEDAKFVHELTNNVSDRVDILPSNAGDGIRECFRSA